MRKIKLGFLSVALSLCTSVFSQSTEALRFAKGIDGQSIEEYIRILASDEMEGRETGMRGQKMAADYLVSSLAEMDPTKEVFDRIEQQIYPLKTESSEASFMRLNGDTLRFIDDFYFFPGFIDGRMEISSVIFAGYGINESGYNDYDGIDVKDKVVMVLSGEPFNKKGNSIISGSSLVSGWSTDRRKKMAEAKEQGAKSLIVVNMNYDNYVSRIRYYLESPNMKLDYRKDAFEDLLPTIFIRPEVANVILQNEKLNNVEKIKQAIYKKAKTVSMECSTELTLDIKRDIVNFEASNVAALIQGSDSILKREVVVISAHYDHIGIVDGLINNGADDDGSGTASVLALAKAYASATLNGKRPRRSILFLFFSGEEKGLLGSEWFVNYPIIPLSSIVCDLNVDMIGRVDSEHEGQDNYVYLIGADKLSKDLHDLSEKTNELYVGLTLDYTYNDANDPNRFYYRSDHYNFAKNGIPVIFYFSGVHEDYHQPGDDADKIMFKKTAKIASLIFLTSWEIANREERLKVDKLN